MIKTVVIPRNSEISVSELEGLHVIIKNFSAGIIYASASPNVTVGGDNVKAIPPLSGEIIRDVSDSTVYIISPDIDGAQVECEGTLFLNQSFATKFSTMDRSAVDASYGQKWIELPSDTTNILDFVANNSSIQEKRIYHLLNGIGVPIQFGYSPSDNDFTYEVNSLINGWSTVIAFDNKSSNIFSNSLCDGVWSGWTEFGSSSGGTSETAIGQDWIELESGTTNILEYVLENPQSTETRQLRLLNGKGCPTEYGYSEDDNDFLYEVQWLNEGDTPNVTIIAYDNRSNNVFVNTYSNGTWKGWSPFGTDVEIASDDEVKNILYGE